MNHTRLITQQGNLEPRYDRVIVYPASGPRMPPPELSRAAPGTIRSLCVLDRAGELLTDQEIQREAQKLFCVAMADPVTTYVVMRLGLPPARIARIFRGLRVPPNVSLPRQYWDAIDHAGDNRPPPQTSDRYAAYFATDHWRDLKKRVFERWGEICLNCSADHGIEGHHIRYRSDLRDCTVEDVIPLCHDCHEHYHRVKRDHRQALLPIVTATTPGIMVSELRRMFKETGCRKVHLRSQLNAVKEVSSH